jgi:pimeloyl-ACP methyl ester carboxylesterase
LGKCIAAAQTAVIFGAKPQQELRRAIQMRVQVRDIRLFFDIEGSKLRPLGPGMREVPTLLLLHGGPGFDHTEFKVGFSRLADIAQVLYLDHRGNGRSDAGDSGRWTLQTWADDVHAFCDALEIERPIVMGHSFGGIVAMLYSIHYPDHPAKLILSSTSVQPVGERSYGMFEKLGGAAARAAAVSFWTNPGSETARRYREVCQPLYSQRPLPPGFYSRAIRNPEMRLVFVEEELKSTAILDRLSDIKCPTLVLSGELDPVTPLADAEEIMAALRPELRQYRRFKGAGHHLFWDAPEPFFEALRAFIII